MKDIRDPKSNTEESVHFGKRVLYTEEFLQVWKSLPLQKQRIVRKKVGLLLANPGHPSLKVHRLRRADSEVWECFLIGSFPHRLLFQRQGDKILLVHMGNRVTRTSTTPPTNEPIPGRRAVAQITESAKAPHTAQPQKSNREDFVVADGEKVLTAFLESEPQYENLYRRLADI